MIILRNKYYSREEEIAQIPAAPETEEYSHLRAAIEKKPSQQAAIINEQYETRERSIKKLGVEEKLSGKNKGEVNLRTRQERECNLDDRDASLDTLNQFLGGTLQQKEYREKVPSDIAAEGKRSGVIQKDKNGSWRIISYKTNPPEFWDAHYDSKEEAEKALAAYHANRRH